MSTEKEISEQLRLEAAREAEAEYVRRLDVMDREDAKQRKGWVRGVVASKTQEWRMAAGPVESKAAAESMATRAFDLWDAIEAENERRYP